MELLKNIGVQAQTHLQKKKGVREKGQEEE